MSIFFVTILAISAAPNGTTQEATAQTIAVPAVQTAAAAAVRSGRELSEAAHATMRRWAKATDQDADPAARELLGIYREIQQDTRMARSQRETLRLTVRARLDQLCTQISKRIAQDKAAAKTNAAVVAALKSYGARPSPRLGCRRVAGRASADLRPARTPTPTTASNWSI